MSARALALTLDLDGPAEYARLHGVTATADPLVAYRAPLARFAELCHEAGGPGTLFAVGRDAHGEGAAALARLAQRGFEVGNHSFAHDYRLSRAPRAAIHDDVARAQDALAAACGAAPTGFRAPGHHLSLPLLDTLEELGFAYDSSVMPSPPYFVAKALVLGAYKLARRSSAALLGSPRTALAPRGPYAPGHDPYRRGTRPLVELPIAVATPLGLPLTGAALLLAPAWLRRALVASLAQLDLVVLNVHAMDLADADALPEALRRRQPELAIAWSERALRLREVVRSLACGRTVTTCATVATTWGEQRSRDYSNAGKLTTLGSSGGGLGAREALKSTTVASGKARR